VKLEQNFQQDLPKVLANIHKKASHKSNVERKCNEENEHMHVRKNMKEREKRNPTIERVSSSW
jgi:hypothetical protein